MKLTIHCNSVDEYFQLPREEREWLGLYKVPFSLPSELLQNSKSEKGWTTFYKEISKQYPFQYFFRYWLTSTKNPFYSFVLYRLFWPIRELKWTTKNIISPCHPRWRKVLPRHKYSDITELVVTSNFALILDFYHEEVCNGWVDWKSDKNHLTFYNQLKNYVYWIEKAKPKLEKQLDKELTKATKKRIYDPKGKFDYNATYAKYNKIEEEIKTTTTEILKWFVDNRSAFWT